MYWMYTEIILLGLLARLADTIENSSLIARGMSPSSGYTDYIGFAWISLGSMSSGAF